MRATRRSRSSGKDKNGTLADVLGWIFFAIICIAALVAPVLLVITHLGKS